MEPALLSVEGYSNHAFETSDDFMRDDVFQRVYQQGSTISKSDAPIIPSDNFSNKQLSTVFIIHSDYYKKVPFPDDKFSKVQCDLSYKILKKDDSNDEGREGPCKGWLTSTNFFVYLSHFLSAWGDRMWSFGVGLFLINISPESLQLTAIYGLCMGLSILLFGALVGDIVDETPRLRAAQTALVLQNAFVLACAIVVYIFLVYRGEIVSFGGWTTHVAYAAIITLSVLARLTGMARQIAVEKDWIVEMCGKDFDMLATMTASLRRIDLVTQVLAPMATGLIMTFAGVEFGALFIGGWNLISVVVEYYFLWKVYNTVPALKRKKNLKKSQIAMIEQTKNDNEEALVQATDMKADDQKSNEESPDKITECEKEKDDETKDRESSVDGANFDISKDLDNDAAEPGQAEHKTGEKPEEAPRRCKFPRIFDSLERLFRGWPVYAKYDVVHAGLALACLYLTVLGFDSVTVGYAKMQGVSEGLVGVMMGVAAIFGIFGTFMYPVMRHRIGLPRTGIFGLSFEILSLTLCVISVWMPGTKFDLSHNDALISSSDGNNCTEVSEMVPDVFNATGQRVVSLTSYSNVSVTFYDMVDVVNVTRPCSQQKDESSPQVSIWMLLAGIVTARFGLWVADLSITQLFMERVTESERGKVNGVQNSLNQLMDMLKFLMVVLAPYEHQFGLLVLISFSFICIGWLFYAYFLRKMRGHFFHCEKCLVSCGKVPNGNVNALENDNKSQV